MGIEEMEWAGASTAEWRSATRDKAARGSAWSPIVNEWQWSLSPQKNELLLEVVTNALSLYGASHNNNFVQGSFMSTPVTQSPRSVPNYVGPPTSANATYVGGTIATPPTVFSRPPSDSPPAPLLGSPLPSSSRPSSSMNAERLTPSSPSITARTKLRSEENINPASAKSGARTKAKHNAKKTGGQKRQSMPEVRRERDDTPVTPRDKSASDKKAGSEKKARRTERRPLARHDAKKLKLHLKEWIRDNPAAGLFEYLSNSRDPAFQCVDDSLNATEIRHAILYRFNMANRIAKNMDWKKILGKESIVTICTAIQEQIVPLEAASEDSMAIPKALMVRAMAVALDYYHRKELASLVNPPIHSINVEMAPDKWAIKRALDACDFTDEDGRKSVLRADGELTRDAKSFFCGPKNTAFFKKVKADHERTGTMVSFFENVPAKLDEFIETLYTAIEAKALVEVPKDKKVQETEREQKIAQTCYNGVMSVLVLRNPHFIGTPLVTSKIWAGQSGYAAVKAALERFVSGDSSSEVV
jgi:hypothetical protein